MQGVDTTRDSSTGEAAGRLLVFEGPDGIGKTELSREVARRLEDRGLRVKLYSFPGRRPGTLGALVYDLHHQAEARFEISHIDPLAMQALHVAAHLDVIPSLKAMISSGDVVVLDRFWWSTWVYGRLAGIAEDVLRALIEAEVLAWRPVTPMAVVVLDRDEPFRPELSPDEFRVAREAYRNVAQEWPCPYRVVRAINDDTIAVVAARILAGLESDLPATAPAAD